MRKRAIIHLPFICGGWGKGIFLVIILFIQSPVFGCLPWSQIFSQIAIWHSHCPSHIAPSGPPASRLENFTAWGHESVHEVAATSRWISHLQSSYMLLLAVFLNTQHLKNGDWKSQISVIHIFILEH